MKRRVAIVGAGMVSSLGHTVSDAFARLKILRNCVKVSEDLATYKGLHTALWAPSGYVRPESYTRKVVRTMSPVSEMALFATEQALQDAGLAEDVATLKGGRLGIAYGSCSGGVEANLDYMSVLVSREVKNVTSSTYLKVMPQTTAVNLSVHFGTTGRLLPTGTACTSGSLAIGEAYETIVSGKQDVMIAGGSEEFSATQVAVFDTLFSTSCLNETPERTPCAFDKSRTGLVVGDGAATLILEELEHARRQSPLVRERWRNHQTRRNTSEVFTPPNAKLLDIAYSVSRARPSPWMKSFSPQRTSGSTRFRFGANQPLRIISTVRMASIAPQAPSVCPV